MVWVVLAHLDPLSSMICVFQVVARADLTSSQSGDAGNPKHVTQGPKATRTKFDAVLF